MSPHDDQIGLHFARGTGDLVHRITMNVYTDPRIFDLAAAVEKLPNTAPMHRSVQAATGTDVETPLPHAVGEGGPERVANKAATVAVYGRCAASIGSNEKVTSPPDLLGKDADLALKCTHRHNSGRRGSNPRHSRWQRDALPLSYARESELKYSKGARQAKARRMQREALQGPGRPGPRKICPPADFS